MVFKNRFDAGEQLAAKLQAFKNNEKVIILAIPRGGLEIGYVLAQELNAPLDVLLTKKIGAPSNPECAIGAVSLNNYVIDHRYQHYAETLSHYLTREIPRIQNTLKERYETYREIKKPLSLKDKIIILADDGVATGHTLLAALKLLKKEHPQKIIVALPIAPIDTLSQIMAHADETICLSTPDPFYSVSQAYLSFAQVSDAEALQLLKEANIS